MKKLQLCISKNPGEPYNSDKEIARIEENGKMILEKKDSARLYPNNTNLFRKLKEKLKKINNTEENRSSKKRKTEHVKRNRFSKLNNERSMKEKEVRLDHVTSAEFGELSTPFRTQLESINNYLENHEGFNLHKFDDGSRISIYQKGSLLKICQENQPYWTIVAALFLMFYFIFGMAQFSYVIALSCIPLMWLKPIAKLNEKSNVYQASKVVEYSPKIVFEYLKNHYRQEVKFLGGRVVENFKEVSQDPEKQTVEFSFKLFPAHEDIRRTFTQKVEAKAYQYWCRDENENRYILTQISEKSSSSSIIYEEAFVIVGSSKQPDQCLIYFFTDIGCPENFLSEINSENITLAYMQENTEKSDCLEEEVFEDKLNTEVINRKVLRTTGVTEKGGPFHNYDTNKNSFTIDDDNPGVTIQRDPRFSTVYSHQMAMKPREELKHHEKNVIISQTPLTMSERFVGYFRMEDGLLWCHNQEELASQKGLIVELLKRAGEKLMKGEGVVSISLPVRIFEKRSALERCGDLWTTGPKYLPLAAREINPVERFKNVICFMIGSMYMVCQQRKPFNPILGETYQGYWPDGTKIYIEHISHHPPISFFQVEHPDGEFVFEGSYMYTAKLINLGNSVRGRQVGMNWVRFKDGTVIKYEYPFMRINGLMINKRTIQWEGSIKFEDEKNGLECELKFPASGIFGGLDTGKTFDQVEGRIFQDGEEICEVEGSWLSHLNFNGIEYWRLETSNIILPVRVDEDILLPSDCLYREDSQALATGDLELAQKEKERLEVLQRHDKKLRIANRRS